MGRTVYGGGGIVPDVFIARDTTGITSYFKDAYFNGLIFQYAYNFVDKHRKQLSQCEDLPALVKMLKRKGLVEDFVNFASKAGLKRRNLMIQRSYKLLYSYLSSAIVADVLDENEATAYANQTDQAVLKATSVLESDNAFPQVKKNEKGKKQALASFRNRWMLTAFHTPMPFSSHTGWWKHTLAVEEKKQSGKKRPILS